jgi:hypothetical protein
LLLQSIFDGTGYLRILKNRFIHGAVQLLKKRPHLLGIQVGPLSRRRRPLTQLKES